MDDHVSVAFLDDVYDELFASPLSPLTHAPDVAGVERVSELADEDAVKDADAEDEVQRLRRLLNTAALEREKLTAQLETARNLVFTKEGEVKFLREKQLEEQLRITNLRKEMEHKHRDLDASLKGREEKLEKENKALKTRLVYRDHDLAEMEQELLSVRRENRRINASGSFSQPGPAQPIAVPVVANVVAPSLPLIPPTAAPLRQSITPQAVWALKRLTARVEYAAVSDPGSVQTKAINGRMDENSVIVSWHGSNHVNAFNQGIYEHSLGELVDALHVLDNADVEGSQSWAVADDLCRGLHNLSNNRDMLATLERTLHRLTQLEAAAHPAAVVRTIYLALSVLRILLPERRIKPLSSCIKWNVNFNESSQPPEKAATGLADEAIDSSVLDPLLRTLHTVVTASHCTGEIMVLAIDCVGKIVAQTGDDELRRAFLVDTMPACLAATSAWAQSSYALASQATTRCISVATHLLSDKRITLHTGVARPCLLDPACGPLAWSPLYAEVVTMQATILQFLSVACATRGTLLMDTTCVCVSHLMCSLLALLDNYLIVLTDDCRLARAATLTPLGCDMVRVVRDALGLLHHVCGALHDFDRQLRPVRHIYASVGTRLVYMFSSWVPALVAQPKSNLTLSVAQVAESETQAQELLEWLEEELTGN